MHLSKKTVLLVVFSVGLMFCDFPPFFWNLNYIPCVSFCRKNLLRFIVKDPFTCNSPSVVFTVSEAYDEANKLL